ncbi:hypothetical protein PISMIDRAFT_118311, partial [Pisolithus microcarpus 441]
SKVFNGLRVELTLLRFGIETVVLESVKNLSNMFCVVFEIIRVHKDGVDKMLASCRGIGKSKWHDEPLIGSIASPECHLSFISIHIVQSTIVLKLGHPTCTFSPKSRTS